jgi:hypothetical protein
VRADLSRCAVPVGPPFAFGNGKSPNADPGKKLMNLAIRLRMAVGGAVCGSFLGILGGGVAGTVCGALVGNFGLGLDGALLGGGILAGVGAVFGAVIGPPPLPEERAESSPLPLNHPISSPAHQRVSSNGGR